MGLTTIEDNWVGKCVAVRRLKNFAAVRIVWKQASDSLTNLLRLNEAQTSDIG